MKAKFTCYIRRGFGNEKENKEIDISITDKDEESILKTFKTIINLNNLVDFSYEIEEESLENDNFEEKN